MVRKYGSRVSATMLIVSLIVTCFSKVGFTQRGLYPQERQD
jgi:hypothetical protein